MEIQKDDHKAVFGIYDSRTKLEAGVERLKTESFTASDVSVLMPDPAGSQKFAHDNSTKAPEGATTGAGTGLVLGGALGWLVGIGALAIPGVGPFIAAGPIVALMAGAGAGAALGGIAGGLVGMGIPEYEAKRYETFVKDGGMLLSVHTADSELTKKAKLIFEQTGARDISANSEISDAHMAKNKVVDAKQTITRI